jgi:hypothetical protein
MMGRSIPGVELVAGSGGWAEYEHRPVSPPGVQRLFVRGGRCRTEEGLFAEVSAALQFPSHFGWGWDSFAECLADLDAWPSDRWIEIVVVDLDLVLVDAPARRPSFDAIVAEVVSNDPRLRVVGLVPET